MAELRTVGPGVDVTRGVQRGVNILGGLEAIKAGKAAEERRKTEFAIDIAAKKERAKNVASEQKYNVGIRTIKAGKDMGNLSLINRGYRDSVSALGQEIPLNFEIQQEDIDQLLKVVDQKDPEVQKIMEKEFSQKVGAQMDAFAVRAESFGLVSGVTEELAEEKAIAKEEATFERTEERRKAVQVEKEEATAQALEGIAGLDPTIKSVLPLVSSGKVSGAVLNILASQTGTTFVSDLAGTGAFKGKKVTGVFDRKGKLVAQFEEGKPITKRQIVQERNMFQETITKGMFWTEDANGNPLLQYVTPQEVTAEGVPVPPKEEVRTFDEKSELVSRLEAIGSTEDFDPLKFLATAGITSDVTDDEIVDAYKIALKAQGGEAKGDPKIREKQFKAGKGRLERLSGGIKSLFTIGEEQRLIPKKEKEKDAKEFAGRVTDIIQKAATKESLTDEEKRELQEALKSLDEGIE